jgi:uncharacterized cysteine cluster protein YcgN (CxxCxxCC family)
MNFWEKPLAQLDDQEWEQLCDGCGRCCLKKLQDIDSDAVHYTRVVCRYFNESNSRCGCYAERTRLVPDCLVVKTMDLSQVHWMPDTCAYRLRHEGRPLYNWHPLIAGSRESMESAGISIRGKVLSEEYVHEDGLAEHIIRWVNAK